MKRLSAILILILLTSLCALPCLAETTNTVFYTEDSAPHPQNSVRIDVKTTVMMLSRENQDLWTAYLEGDIQFGWYLDGTLVAGANQDSFTLTEEHLGCYLQAEVTCGGVSTLGKSLLVTQKVSPPRIMTSLLPDATVGKPYQVVLDCSDPAAVFATADPSEFSKTDLTLSTDGILSGTPKTAGVYRFTVTATNDGGKDTCTYILTVNEPPHMHVYGEWVIIREPTCAVQGKRQKTCDCGDTVTEWLDLTAHSWDNGVITTPPTEEEAGIKTHTCTVCNKTATSEVDKLPHTHRFREWTVVEKPTCHKKGYNLRTCACGETETEYVGMLAHIWDDGEVTKEPTEEEEGVRTFTCTLCGDQKTAAIERLPHVHQYGERTVTKEPTCKEEGVTTKTCTCGDSIFETLPKIDHDWDTGKVTKEPTEDEEGVRTFTCSLCGDTKTESIPTLEHIHRYGDWILTKSPTCKEEGVKTKTCACGDAISEILPKIDHDWDTGKVTKEPTEDKEGVKTFTCSLCRDTKTLSIPALEHVHRYGDWMLTKSPTCKEEGVKTKTCACGDAVSETLPKAEHIWDMGAITKEPTFDTDGERTFTCIVCGAVHTEPIPRDPHVHTYGEWTVTQEATCETEGQMQKNCICGDVWTKSIGKTEHIWDGGEIVKEPSATEQGEKLYTCTACQGTKTETLPSVSTKVPSDTDTEGNENYYAPDSLPQVRTILFISCLATVFVGLLTWLVLKKNKNTSNG